MCLFSRLSGFDLIKTQKVLILHNPLSTTLRYPINGSNSYQGSSIIGFDSTNHVIPGLHSNRFIASSTNLLYSPSPDSVVRPPAEFFAASQRLRFLQSSSYSYITFQFKFKFAFLKKCQPPQQSSHLWNGDQWHWVCWFRFRSYSIFHFFFSYFILFLFTFY